MHNICRHTWMLLVFTKDYFPTTYALVGMFEKDRATDIREENAADDENELR